MPNSILTATAVTREALRILHQNLNFIGSINREYDDQYAKNGAKIGDTLKIRQPNRYTVGTGATITPQDTTETSVDLKIQTQKHVPIKFGAAEMALSLDDFSDRILKPAMSVLAANIEADVMSTVYKDVYQSVWNGGSANTLAKVAQGRTILQRSLTPLSDRSACLNPQDMADIVTAGSTIFNPQAEIAKQYKDGYVGRQGGFDYLENTMWGAHTRGAGNTAYTTSTTALTAGQATMTVASGAGALNVGDVFTIAGINSVHPETKVSTGLPQQFVVTAAYAGGAGTVSFAPSIYTTGALQNVVAASTSATAAITFAGTLSTAVGTSLLYHKDAFTFATADLYLPKDTDFAARESFDGISMRVARQWDVTTDALVTRLDVLYGFKTIRPELAVRLHNN
jgi:hypothetical protein